jgi:hypothetical protein
MILPKLSRTALAVAVGSSALSATVLVPSAAIAAPTAKIWSAGSTIYARADRLPPGHKVCTMHVPPAPYDIVGTYLGSQQGTNITRSTNGSSITLEMRGAWPASYVVHFECSNNDVSFHYSVDRRVSVGGLS